jgi:pimeloyl-ACP methyl ester carboxylesterase
MIEQKNRSSNGSGFFIENPIFIENKPMYPNYLSIDTLNLAYYENHPEKDQTIFFIHGNSSSSRTWQRQMMSPLFAGYRLIAIDLPGHGASGPATKPSDDYTAKGVAALLTKVIETLAHGPYLLCATSMATNIVAEMIPGDIEPVGILMEGASLMGEGVGIDKIAQPGGDISAITKDEAEISSVEAYSQFAFHAVDVDTRRLFVEDFLKVQAPFRTTMIGSIFSGQLSDQIALMRTLSCPVAYVYGAEERVINTEYLLNVDVPKWGDKIWKIPDAGHLAHVEQPESFNTLLLSFVQDCFK